MAGSIATAALAALTTSAAQAASGTTVSLGSYGSPSAADNTSALNNALADAGSGGTVTVPAGVWNIGTVNINQSVNIVGIDTGTTRFAYISNAFGHAYGLSINPSGVGTTISKMGMYSNGGGTSSYVHVVGDTHLDQCAFYEPLMYANDVNSGATLTVTASTYIGKALSNNQAIGIVANGANANLNVSGTTFSGLYGGHQANGAGTITATNNTYLGMWFFANPTVCAGVVSSATSTSVTARSSLNTSNITNMTNATAVAWKTMSSSSTVSPVSGKSGWFTISGVTPEPRMMVRNGSRFGIVLDVSGSQARIPYWHTFSSCYPQATPTTSQSGMIVERPYIGRVSSVSGSTVTVKSWHAGSKGTNEVPPAGARLQLNAAASYMCFTGGGTSAMIVTGCTCVAVWADSISSIGGQNVQVTNNTIYDGQDVSVTLEQVTNGCVASNNTAYRSGTAMVYIGSGSAQVSANTSHGANMMTDNSPSYSAFTMQGCPWANVWSNTAIYGGAPYEISGYSIDGVDGQDNTSDATRQNGPWATDLYINSNTATGYPKYDVTIWGTKAFVEPGHYSWASGTRFNLLQNATQKMVTP